MGSPAKGEGYALRGVPPVTPVRPAAKTPAEAAAAEAAAAADRRSRVVFSNDVSASAVYKSPQNVPQNALPLNGTAEVPHEVQQASVQPASPPVPGSNLPRLAGVGIIFRKGIKCVCPAPALA